MPDLPTALVICATDPARDPRPNRMIRWLAPHFAVRVISSGSVPVSGTTAIPLPAPSGNRLLRKMRASVGLKLRRFEARLWPPGMRALAAAERAQDPKFIVVHDLALLPLALAIRGSGRVFFDAREYYPRQFEDRWFWRFFLRDFNRYLARTYLVRADVMVTVNRGLAAEYRREYGVNCGVLPGYPAAVDLTPAPVDPARIRIIHHGFATRSRRIELMIDAMRLVDERCHLDLMLAGEEPGYVAKLKARAAGLSRVAFRDPVPFQDLIRDTNRYDVGLYVLPPTSFNTRHALPNKFFEFIQARLLVAIGPSVEMAPYVKQYDLGVVAEDFRPETMARHLNALTPERIAACKQNADRAARELTAARTGEQVLRVALGGAGVEALA